MKIRLFTTIFLTVFIISTHAQISGLQKNDLKNFSYALLDGRNVALYVKLGLGRTDKSMDTKVGSMMADVFFAERNFRLGQTWMIKKQLEDLILPFRRGTEVRLNDPELQIFARGVNDLAIVYHHLGLLEKSENYAKWALEMREQRFGKNNLATISSYNNLGALYKDMGKYSESNSLFEQCKQLLTRQGMNESMEYAVTLNNQSTLQLTLGQVETAASTSNQSIAIADRFTGDKSKDFLSFLLNSALINQELKNYDQAEALLLRVKEIKEKRFGKKSSQYARTLNNLAAMYLENGKTGEVEGLLKTALSIYKKYYGENHPTTAGIISNLGRYYYAIGNYNEGLNILLKAKQVQAYILGKYHPEYIKTLETLALIYWDTGKISEASKEFDLINGGIKDQIATYFPAMSEENKTKFWDRSRHFLMKYYSFVIANYDKDQSLSSKMYDMHLVTKGLLLSESHKLKSVFLESDNEEFKKKYRRWLSMKEELAKYNAMPKKSVFSLGVNLLKFRNKVDQLEKELGQESNEFSKGYKSHIQTTDSIKSRLNENEVAVEIIRVDLFKRKFIDEVTYAVLLLDEINKHPDLVKIPDGKNLDSRNFKLYRNSIKLKVADDHSYKAYWKSVDNALTGKSKVFLSQDGIYNQINVNTLMNGEGQPVIDNYQIVFVASTRDISSIISVSTLDDVVLVGNPYYGNPNYAPLPGTKVEVESINEVMTTREIGSLVLTDKMATESRLKEAVNNPGVLHISTHGYFTPDKYAYDNKVFGEEIERVVVNPLLRSGLILAEPKAEPSKFDFLSSRKGEDGLLTAYEAMNFDLDETELVVLSACETGLGDLKAGEGVYGLQRAFQVAGADAIVTSLWKVNDEATQLLMTTFYNKWLESGDKQKAFLFAQKKIKQEFKDPYYWGAFVMMN